MGLKPKRAYLSSISISVMEHDTLLNTNSTMLLKDDSQSFPNGSPSLDDISLLKTAVVINGTFPINNGHGHHEERIPTSVPLQVEVNGFREGVPSKLTSSPQTGRNSLISSSSSLPTPLLELGVASDSSLPTGDVIPKHESLGLGNTGSINIPSSDDASLKNNNCSASQSQKDCDKRSEERPLKRKTVMERISQVQSCGKIKFLVPQCEGLSASQLSTLARKMKGADSGLPKFIRNQVFEEQDMSNLSRISESTPGDFDEKTDISDIETDFTESLSTKTVQWTSKKLRFESNDIRIRNELESKYALLETLQQRQADSRLYLVFEEQNEDSCARSRAVSCPERRQLIRHTFGSSSREPVDYAQMQPSTSKDTSRDLQWYKSLEYSEDAPVDRRMQSYMHLLSMVPSAVLRKRVDRSIWLNDHELNEERQRNGWNRTAERERRKQRERASAAGDDSSDYQDTDESDDEYVPKTLPISRPSGYKYKRKRGRPPKEGRDPPTPLAKIGRRHSVANSSRSRQYEVDEYLPECGTAHLPQKIDYKEIIIPNWHEHGESYEETADPSVCQSCSSDLLLAVAQSHHIQEFHEKRRFQAYRDRAARDKAERENSVMGSDPPSGQHTPQPVIVPPFDPKSIVPLATWRSSEAKPYSPRTFSDS